jgi:hypothetical protein
MKDCFIILFILATAMASDRGTVATLVATNANAKLATQLETYQEYIKKLNEEIAELKTDMKLAWQLMAPWIPSTPVPHKRNIQGQERWTSG